MILLRTSGIHCLSPSRVASLITVSAESVSIGETFISQGSIPGDLDNYKRVNTQLGIGPHFIHDHMARACVPELVYPALSK